MAEISWFSLKRYFRFDEGEIRAFIGAAVAFAFILSFDQWGQEVFSVAEGLKNFAIALVLVTASLFIHDSAHRLVALRLGYISKLRNWWYGLAFCLLIVILTNGKLKLFLGPTVWFTHIAIRSAGRTEYVDSPKSYGFIALFGPIASLLFAGLIRFLAEWLPFNPVTVNQLVYFNIVFGVLAFLPIPPLDGSKFFFYKQWPYCFILGTMVAYAVLHYIGIPSLLLSLIFGIAAGAFWLYKVEKYIKIK